MKRIGLLGGMSWQSTAEYYRLINEAVASRRGAVHSADLVMVSVDFAEIEALQVSGRWDEAGRRLATEARALEAAGAELIVLCTNTMHKVADQIEAAVQIPLLHLADATADAVEAARVTKVALLGTAFTMEQEFYRDRLAGHGLDVIIPDPAARADVHRIIYDELCQGVIRGESRARYLDVVADLVTAGAEGIILGCTEIELLLDPDRTPEVEVPLFATTRIHALAAVEAALAAPELPEEVEIVRLEPADWQSFKDVRLACLKDAPDAFGSTYADWVNAPDERWQTRVTQVPLNLVARRDGQTVGVVSGSLDGDDWVELISMWVAPSVRGTGVAGALIERVVHWAAGQGRSTYLMVRSANPAARTAYERAGFIDVGVPDDQPADEPEERRMERRAR